MLKGSLPLLMSLFLWNNVEMTECFITLTTASSSSSLLNVASNFPFDKSNNNNSEIDAHRNIKNVVLQWVYPRLVEWKERYGTPNIPLNTEGGKACQILRNMHIQQKLSANEVEILEKLGFKFELQYEDLYWEANFDDMFSKLLTQRYYTRTNNNNNSDIFGTSETAEVVTVMADDIDPELEAWVKGIRRLGKDRIQPEHALRLTYIGFQWAEKEESRFRLRYDDIKHNIELYGKAYLQKPEVQGWISKQRSKRIMYKLSDKKYRYMIELLGKNWMEQ